MSCFASLLMRISPVRCNILMRPEAATRLDQMTDGSRNADGDGEKSFTEDGYEILDRKVMYLPDPRISVAGHGVLSGYWYLAFILSLLWVVFNFVSYTPEETFAMPMMSTVDPTIPIRLSVSCTSHTGVNLYQNYTSPSSGSQCLNTTGVQLTRAELNSGNNFNASFSTSLCYAPESVYSAAVSFPPIAGLWVRFDNVSEHDSCVVDLYSLLPTTGSTERPMKRLMVESGFVKTFWAGYSTIKVKHDDMREKDQTLMPIYYELDGMRFEGTGDFSSIVVIKLLQTANVITQYDMRSWTRAWGMFGTVWYLAGYPLWWITPLVIALFPRNFFEDAKEHKIDGYTDNVLAAAWKPSVYIGTAEGVISRVKRAIAP